jgi:hypothetical protein
MTTNDTRCTHEIKSMIATAKTAWNRKKALFTRKLDLKLNEEINEQLHLEHSFVWC